MFPSFFLNTENNYFYNYHYFIVFVLNRICTLAPSLYDGGWETKGRESKLELFHLSLSLRPLEEQASSLGRGPSLTRTEKGCLKVKQGHKSVR